MSTHAIENAKSWSSQITEWAGYCKLIWCVLIFACATSTATLCWPRRVALTHRWCIFK